MPRRRKPDPGVDRYALLCEIARWPQGFSPVEGVPAKRLDALVADGAAERRYMITYRGVQELTPMDRQGYLVTHVLPGKTGLWIDGREHIVPAPVASHFKFLTQQLGHIAEQAGRYHAELVALRTQVGSADVTPMRKRR